MWSSPLKSSGMWRKVNLMADGLNVNAKEESKDMHLAIDNAIEKIERQLKKHKEKIRGHKTNLTRSEGITAISSFPEEMEDTSEMKVVETRKVVLKPMSLDDAMMEIETSKNRFIIYRDSFTRKCQFDLPARKTVCIHSSKQTVNLRRMSYENH